MISLGSDIDSQSYVMGQVGDDVEIRLLHTGKDWKAQPRLTTSTNCLTTAVTHLVHTYDGTTERLYINGLQHPTTVAQSGIYSNWDVNDKLNIGNEATLDLPWYGTIYLVAVYNRALNQTEIQKNFQAGP